MSIDITTRQASKGAMIGRFIVDSFWSVLKNDVVTLNKFDEHPEVQKLKPWTNPFFTASSLSILNYDTDIFDLVRDGTIKVHIADITSLGPNKVYLSSGEGLLVDALISCTGWRHSPPLDFLSDKLDIGLPRPASTMAADLKSLTARADKEILDRFPRLKDQPTPNPIAKPLPTTTTEDHLTGYHLYRFVIPPSTVQYHDIAFAGACQPISTSLVAQIQALWITAYFDQDKTLSSSLPEQQQIGESAILHNRFGKWRYPHGFGAKNPDFVFDTIPYIDMMLADLGLIRWRKNGRIAEWTEGYGPEDYKDIMKEYVDARSN